MLCVGGSQIPFGWSFLSIAKVPMTWNQGDIWTCEVSRGRPGLCRPECPPHPSECSRRRLRVQLLLPAGQRIEYKYVILEEQVRPRRGVAAARKGVDGKRAAKPAKRAARSRSAACAPFAGLDQARK